MRDGNAPVMAQLGPARARHSLVEWETDFSSQTGASQAGILLGSNEDIPAFRWVEKETGADGLLGARRLRRDRAAPRRRHGLLVNGGASRGNLLSGEADDVILPSAASRPSSGANPGYRAFLANGFNVTRVLVLFYVGGGPRAGSPRSAAIRRDVPPRGHRGGIYPLLRAGDVRLRSRPDRVRRPLGHDEGAARRLRDVLELRRGRAPLGARARRHARGAAQARRAVRADRAAPGATRRGRTRSSCSRTTARPRARPSSSATATALGDLVERSLARGSGHRGRGRRRAAEDGRPRARRGDRPPGEEARRRTTSPTGNVVVLGSGNLGLVYLMEERRRLTLEEIDERHPALVPALREHPHVGFLLVRSAEHGAGRARTLRARATWPTTGSTARIRSRRSHRTRRSTCGAPTVSSTSPTSWSTASTTRSSKRAARSRS